MTKYGRKSDEKNSKIQTASQLQENTHRKWGGGGSPCKNGPLIWALGSTSEVQVELLWAATT